MKNNYINRLENSVKIRDEKLKTIRQELVELLAYFDSPKFYEDSTVQTSDVRNRLQSAMFASLPE